VRDPETQKRIEDNETKLRAVLADDIEWHVPGDKGNVVVIDYVAVARVLDSEGRRSTRYTTSQSADYADVLGWLDWMRTITKQKIRKQHRNA
jgi:hypothetical protein